ncbi:MAG: glycosyltransferase family 9 protein [Nitrospirae bacterium]|nr:glycosyltransferase family 9 protein [Nitrospirota bacterium]
MNVLIVRPDGIGDEILSLPVASALRRQQPQSRIMFLSSAYAAPVLAHHPDLDDVVTVSGEESFAELVALFRRKIDVALFLKPFRRLIMASWWARVPQRVATGYRWYGLFANRRVYEHRSDFTKHEAEYNLGLLRGLGIEPGPVAPPRLVVTPEERAWAASTLATIPSPRVILHPGGFAARRWASRHYWDLVQRLVSEGLAVGLTGNQAEGDRFREEIGRSPGATKGIEDFMGRLSVRQLMAVVAQSQVVVSGATGPAHMAAALGVATVSLFDPRRNNLPIRWAPLGRGFVLRPDVPTCEKCIYEACPYWDCLDRITADGVADRIQSVLTRAESVTVQHV